MAKIEKFVCETCKKETEKDLPKGWIRTDGTLMVFGEDSQSAESDGGDMEFCGRHCLGQFIDNLADQAEALSPAEPTIPAPERPTVETEAPF